MTLRRVLHDDHKNSYVDSPTRDEGTAQEVSIGDSHNKVDDQFGESASNVKITDSPDLRAILFHLSSIDKRLEVLNLSLIHI